MPTVAVGKCCREAEESHSDERLVGNLGIDSNRIPPQKRATRHSPVARIPITRDENARTELRCGAEMLTTPNRQRVHNQLLLGPSFQQGWAVEAADGQLSWFEGSVEEEAGHKNNSTVQQQQKEQAKAKDKPFEIPKNIKTRHKALLAATEADWARGTIREIKCRICPDTELTTWDDFKRHCDTVEAHPLKIFFCDDCGNFFTRKDSLKRHRKNLLAACFSVTREKAAEKRREMQKLHEQFRTRLVRGLEKGENIGMPFSQIIKEKYPESSKKTTGGGRKKAH